MKVWVLVADNDQIIRVYASRERAEQDADTSPRARGDMVIMQTWVIGETGTVEIPCPICRYLDNDDYPSCRKSKGETGAELCKYCAITGTKNLFKRRRSLRDILPWAWR